MFEFTSLVGADRLVHSDGFVNSPPKTSSRFSTPLVRPLDLREISDPPPLPIPPTIAVQTQQPSFEPSTSCEIYNFAALAAPFQTNLTITRRFGTINTASAHVINGHSTTV
jgi:hypothetical protein